MRNIKQNIGFAFGYNIIGIPSPQVITLRSTCCQPMIAPSQWRALAVCRLLEPARRFKPGHRPRPPISG
jgi:hypothetical protein